MEMGEVEVEPRVKIIEKHHSKGLVGDDQRLVKRLVGQNGR